MAIALTSHPDAMRVTMERALGTKPSEAEVEEQRKSLREALEDKRITTTVPRSKAVGDMIAINVDPSDDGKERKRPRPIWEVLDRDARPSWRELPGLLGGSLRLVWSAGLSSFDTIGMRAAGRRRLA